MNIRILPLLVIVFSGCLLATSCQSPQAANENSTARPISEVSTNATTNRTFWAKTKDGILSFPKVFARSDSPQTNAASLNATQTPGLATQLPLLPNPFSSLFESSKYLSFTPASGIPGISGSLLRVQQPEKALTQKPNVLERLNFFKPKEVVSTNQPPPLGSSPEKNYLTLTNAPEKDKVLHLYRLALWELRRGNSSQSRKLFEAALDVVDNRFGRDRNAARARSYFSEEAQKTFVGEPYERVSANLYLGFLCLMDGQKDVAKACFRNAEWEDADAEKDAYQSDFVIPYYINGILAESGDAERFYQSATNSCQVYAAPPPYSSPPPNVVLLLDYGNGPKKFVIGQDQRELQFHEGETTTSSIRVTVGTNTVVANTYEDITFQAITRGGRVMDHILKHKSHAKQGAKLTGWGAILASQGLMLAGGDSRVAAGIMVGGWLMTKASDQIKPRADDRCWDNLPQCLTTAAFQLPPGKHVLRVEFLDRDGNAQKSLTREASVIVEENNITAAYVSEHSTSVVQRSSL